MARKWGHDMATFPAFPCNCVALFVSLLFKAAAYSLDTSAVGSEPPEHSAGGGSTGGRHVLKFDATSFSNSGIATVRLYIVAAATIAQHFNAEFVLPDVGHDNHLAAMPQYGPGEESKLHAFGYYFDQDYFISAARQRVNLTSITSAGESTACGHDAVVWHQVALTQSDIGNRSFLQDAYPLRRCLHVDMGFPSIGVHTTVGLRTVRAAVARALRPSQRLRLAESAIRATLHYGTLQQAVDCGHQRTWGYSREGCAEGCSVLPKQRKPVEYMYSYNAVYIRADSDWQSMCESYFLDNCFYPLPAYVEASARHFQRDLPLLVAGKLSRNSSALSLFSEHFRSVWSLSQLQAAFLSCCKNKSPGDDCHHLIEAVSGHNVQIDAACMAVELLGEHDFALIEHELCSTARSFVGNMLSSFTFNVRDAQAGACRADLERRSGAADAWRCPGGGGSCMLARAFALRWLSDGACGGSYVVGPHPSECGRDAFRSLCRRDADLYVSGCDNTRGLALLSCWYRVLLGGTVEEANRGEARRLEERIMQRMMNREEP